MRSIIIILSTVFSISLQGQIKVVSSASIFNDMVKNIGGEKVTAISIVPIGSDPHKYEATPSDVELLKSANLIMINGLTFEGWIQKVISNSGTKASTILITDGISPIESEDHQGATDPHAWMDAANGTVYAENIYEALVKADPVNEPYYTDNYQRYRNELLELDIYITRKIQSIPFKKRILITSHDAFSYFGRRYGMKINAVMGVSTEAEAQSSDMQRIVNSIRENEVPAIFVESTINPKMLKQIAKDNNVKIGGELFADSLGEEGSEGDTYIKMLKHNADIIANALTQDGNSKLDSQHEHQDLKTPMWGYLFIGIVMGLLFALMYHKMNQ